MLPSEDTDLHSISPATILTLIAEDNTSRFSTPITRRLLKKQQFCLQADDGVNRSVTNNRDMLHVSWDIVEFIIGGIGDGIKCTAKGIFHLLCDDGSVLLVTMCYSPVATETVVSPTDIAFINANKYYSWWQNNNCASGEGSLRFYNSDGLTTSTVALKMRNKMWYILQDTASIIYQAKIASSSDTFFCAVSGNTLHNLWHHRLCHAGKLCTDNIDKVADGVPCLKRRNPLFSCHACNSGKISEQIKGYNSNPLRAQGPGRRFNMDYGFVRGKSVTKGGGSSYHLPQWIQLLLTHR